MPWQSPLIVTVVRDRSEQKQTEELRFDLARTYLGGNNAALLGYPRKNWLQEGFWLSVVHPDDRLAALTFAQNVRERSRFELEYRLIAADARVRHSTFTGVQTLPGEEGAW